MAHVINAGSCDDIRSSLKLGKYNVKDLLSDLRLP